MNQHATLTPTPFSSQDEQARRLGEKLRRQLGPTGCAILREPGVFELMLNADGTLWEDRHGSGMRPVGSMSASAAESFIGTVAGMLNSTVTRENPILECELPMEEPFNGARFEAAIPPVASAPIFSIRMPAAQLFTLDDYVQQGVMTPRQKAAIEQAIARRDSILVVGGTTTGKTTLLNAILAEISRTHPDHRLLLIEDTGELQCRAANKVQLRATDTISMQRLLKAALRLRPDQIIVGEVRGGEALALLKAWNTGHDGGCASVHANDAEAGLIRIEQLIAEVSQSPMQPLIAEAVDVIVWIAKTPEGRRVREVIAVNGFADGSYQVSNLTE